MVKHSRLAFFFYRWKNVNYDVMVEEGLIYHSVDVGEGGR